MYSGCSVFISERTCDLGALPVGAEGTVARVLNDDAGRAARLASLGVTAGARVRVLQRFPGLVFRCDETELAVEPAVARAILVKVG